MVVGAALAAGKWRRGLQLLERVHPPLASLGSGTLRLESHRTLFTLDNSTVKYREKTSAGESASLRAEAIDFWLPSLRSLRPPPPPLSPLPSPLPSPPPLGSTVSAGADGLPGRIERDQSGLYPLWGNAVSSLETLV